MNSINATAAAARLRVSQCIGYAQSLVDQLLEQVGETPTTVARARVFNNTLDVVDAALHTDINAAENEKQAALRDAQSVLEEGIDFVSAIAAEAEDPDLKAELNEFEAGLESLRQTVMDWIGG